MKSDKHMLGSHYSVVIGAAVILAIGGMQYAIAQSEEATSTPAVEEQTVIDEAPAIEAVSEEQGTTPPASEPDTAPANLPVETPVATLPSEAAMQAKNAAMGEIKTLEDVYYRKHGKYLQILKGNGLPDYESGTVTEKLGKGVDNKAYVHVYESVEGKGYQVFYEDGDMLYSVGYGPEAADRTFERSTAVSTSATSTPAVVQ